MRHIGLGVVLALLLIAPQASAQTSSGTINGTLTLAPLTFSGQVEAPAVDVYDATGRFVTRATLGPSLGGTLGQNFPNSTPAGGTFAWFAAGLQEGRYYVRTSSFAQSYPNNGHIGGTSAGWWVDEVYGDIVCVAEDCDPMRGTPIDVVASPTGGSSSPASVDIALDRGAVISGSLPQGTFIAPSATVAIHDSRGVPLPGRATLNAIFLNTQYFANGLPAGTYFLKMTRDPFGKFPAVLYKDMPCNGCAVTSGTPVVVRLGEDKTGVNFIELTDDRAIRGTVRSGGTTLADVTVQVYSPNGALAGSAVSAADGSYTIGGLSPGTYYAATSNSPNSIVDEIYPDIQCPGCDPLTGTALVVQSTSDTTGIDFDLVQGSRMVMMARIPGAPAGSNMRNGVRLSLYTASNALAATGVTLSNGDWVANIPAGTYYVQSGPTNGDVSKRNPTPFCPQGLCPPGSGQAFTFTAAGAGVLSMVEFNLPPVSCGMNLAPVSLASAAVGVPYRQVLAATGGVAPYRYVVASGTVPPGLTLDPSTGVFSGTPTAAGHYTPVLAAVDSGSGCAATRTYVLDVPACVTSTPGQAVSRAMGEPFLVPVQTTCASWTASSNDSWISATPVPAANPTDVLIITSPYTGTAPRTGSVNIGSTVFKVHQNGATREPPFGMLETPPQGATVAGSIAVSGWALDDLAVLKVQIYRDPVAGEAGLVYLGDATIVNGARPDVAAAFPTTPRNTSAGYGYLLLTNMLPNGGNGTFTLHAIAEDIDRLRTTLGSRTITVNNTSATAPFGAIDTPTQGQVIAGQAFINFGWALTPQPKLIPFDGSTIQVVIDGVPAGPLTSYNLFRSDVSTLFPGLANSNGPVGYRTIDTTAISEGVHTIAWIATDDRGQATGIGSRYFTVRNSAWSPALKLGSRVVPPAFTTYERTQTAAALKLPERVDGVELGRQTRSLDTLPQAEDGSRTVDLESMGRLELSLGGPSDGCAPRYEGYLDAGALDPLPVGSSLDPEGTFYWQPGPAFHGTYKVVFIRTSCDGRRERLPVTVKIR